MTRVAKAGRKVQEEARKVLQDLGLTNVAKCLFEHPKHSLWNIECGNTEYIHWPFCEYPLAVQ